MNATERAREIGVTQAALELGIPRPTLRNWVGPRRSAVRTTPPRRRYYTPLRQHSTPQQRAEAIQRAHEVGLTQAAIELDMPRKTLYNWVKKE